MILKTVTSHELLVHVGSLTITVKTMNKNPNIFIITTILVALSYKPLCAIKQLKKGIVKIYTSTATYK